MDQPNVITTPHMIVFEAFIGCRYVLKKLGWQAFKPQVFVWKKIDLDDPSWKECCLFQKTFIFTPLRNASAVHDWGVAIFAQRNDGGVMSDFSSMDQRDAEQMRNELQRMSRWLACRQPWAIAEASGERRPWKKMWSAMQPKKRQGLRSKIAAMEGAPHTRVVWWIKHWYLRSFNTTKVKMTNLSQRSRW